jgi:hypothetical protein
MKLNLTFQVQIEDEDDVIRVGALLRQLVAHGVASSRPRAAEGDCGSSPVERGVNPSGWTFRDFEELWGELSTGARTVLAAMASEPGGISEEELLELLDGQLGAGELDMRTVGGYLSSVALRRSRFGTRQAVYRKDPETGHFTMPPEVASAVLLLANADEGGSKTAGAKVNKSEEMRRLAREGLGTAEIAKLMGVRYQFVHNVLSQAGLL